MKKILLFVAVIAASFSLNAQIPNGSFETWSVVAGDTVIGSGWGGSGVRIYTSINVQSQGGTTPRNATQGTYFVGLNNVTNGGGQLNLGNISSGFPFTQRPVSFSADVMHFPQASESFGVLVTLRKNNGDTVGTGVAAFAQTVTNWAPLTMNVTYRTNVTGNPDSCFIAFLMLPNNNNQASASTALFVDNMRFNTFGVSVPEIASNTLSNINVYPNPANNTTKLSFSLNTTSKVTVSVFDLNGKEVLATSSIMEEGNNQVDLDVAALKPGFYIYNVATESDVVNGKLSIVR